MAVRGHLIDIQGLPSVKISPKKVQKQKFIIAILQTFSICRSDTPQDRFNGIKQVI